MVAVVTVYAANFNGPVGIVLNDTGTLAFITNFRNHTVSRCTVNPTTGEFSGCQTTGSGFSRPEGMVLNDAGTLAFVTNFRNNTVSRCAVNTNGEFSGCQTTGPRFSNPIGIVLNNTEALAFVTNIGNSTVSRCTVNPTTGEFSDCQTTGLGFDGPIGIVLNKTGTLAFVANLGNNTVSRCTVNPTGEFSGCQTTGSGFSNPQGIALNNTGTLAFVTNFVINTISRCMVNPTTGEFSGCRTTGSGFTLPAGIVLNNTGTLAFVTDLGNNTVSRCQVSEAGDFSECVDATKPFFDYRFVVNGRLQDFVNLRLGATGELVIKHVGTVNARALTLIIPPEEATWFPAGGSCPRQNASPLNKGATCTLPYSIPSSINAQEPFMLTAKEGEAIRTILAVHVTTLSVTENNMPKEAVTFYRGQTGNLLLSTVNQVSDFSLNFSPVVLAQYFSGSCESATTLAPGAICRLHYEIRDLGNNVSGRLEVRSGGQTVYTLPVSLLSQRALTVSNTPLIRYNAATLRLTNQTDTPMTDLLFIPSLTGIARINERSADSCGQRLEPGQHCTLTYLANVDADVTSANLRVFGTGITPIAIPLAINPVPEHRLKIENRAGYILRVYYPRLNSEGKVVEGATGDVTVTSKKTIHVVTFNDLTDLPEGITPLTRIRLKPVGAAYSRYLHLPVRNERTIRCSRATVNAHCYYKYA